MIVSGKARVRSLLDELASRSSDPEFFAGLGILPNPDRILRKRGDRPDVLADILTDSHVWGVVQIRTGAVLGTEWLVEPASTRRADRMAAQLCTEMFGWMDMDHLIRTVLDAVLYGHRLMEVLWSRDGGMWIPERIADRPNRRLVYGEDGEPRLRTRKAPITGEAVPAGKLLIARYCASDENPYGEATLSRCLWPHAFKVGGIKFWLVMLEKYGTPWVQGEMPSGTAPEEMRRFRDDLAAAVQDAVLVTQAGNAIRFHEAAGKAASADMYDAFVGHQDRAISKAILGQTLTTEVGSTGSYAAANTHNDVRQDLVEADKRLVCATLDTLLRWVTEINVPGATPPRFKFYEQDVVPTELGTFLDGARKWLRIPERWARARLHIPEPEDGEPVLPGDTATSADMPIVAAFAASDESQTWLDELHAQALERWRAWATQTERAVREAAGADLSTVVAVGLPELATLFEEVLGPAALSAHADVEDELREAASFAAGITPHPLPWPEAVALFQDRVALTPDQWRALAPELKAQAWTMAGAAQIEDVRRAQADLTRIIRDGGTVDDFRRSWPGLDHRQAETTFRNAVQGAYNAARWEASRSPRVLARRPYTEYQTAGDDRVRPEHAALDGLVLRTDDPAWQTIWPANGHNCRCTTRTVSREEALRRGLTIEEGDAILTTPRRVPGTSAAVVPRPDSGWDAPPNVAWRPAWSELPETMVRPFAQQADAHWREALADTEGAPDREAWFQRLGLDPALLARLLGGL